jgi:hypothetical protein
MEVTVQLAPLVIELQVVTSEIAGETLEPPFHVLPSTGKPLCAKAESESRKITAKTFLIAPLSNLA